MKKTLLLRVAFFLLFCFFCKTTASAFAISCEKFGFVSEKTENASNDDEKKDAKDDSVPAVLLIHQIAKHESVNLRIYGESNSCFKLPQSFLLTLERPPNWI